MVQRTSGEFSMCSILARQRGVRIQCSSIILSTMLVIMQYSMKISMQVSMVVGMMGSMNGSSRSMRCITARGYKQWIGRTQLIQREGLSPSGIFTAVVVGISGVGSVIKAEVEAHL